MKAQQAIRDGEAIALEMDKAGHSFRSRVNVYACTPSFMPPLADEKSCGYWIVTIDRDTGVTPMFVTCGHCGNMATSRMYKVSPGSQPTHEWFRPQRVADIPKKYRNEAAFGHIAHGGLLLRAIGKDEWLAPTPETCAFIEAERARFSR